MRRIFTNERVQAGLAHLLGWYLRFALRTTRWRLEGLEHVIPHAAGRPVVVAFWHERLPLMPMLWILARRLREARPGRVHVLMSQHRDGRFIGAVVRQFDIDVVAGSSRRGGSSALRILLGLIARGDHVGITPDGPRGPRRRAAPGVAQLAALSGAPVLPCAAQTTRRWELRSWDRMIVPKPFGRGVVVCEPTITIAREHWQETVGAIGAAITAATEKADRLCLP